MILRPYIKSSNTTCDSTEDLLSRIREVNNNNISLRNTIIGSMDVKALYPSIDVDFAIGKCGEIIVKSDTEISNVDVEELGLFLSLTCSETELSSKDLLKFCPTRNCCGRKPKLAASGVNNNADIRWTGWVPCKEMPKTILEIKTMVAHAIGESLRVTLKNHIYTFDNKLYLQSEGGAIGVGIAGDVAVLFMCWWDNELLERLNRRGRSTHLYARYVDDINIAVDQTPYEESDGETMKHIQEIANDIHPSISVTIDFPSNNTNKRIPVLDLEMWIEDTREKRIIMHTHYMKSISSKHVVNKESALPPRTKTNILTADLVRIMRNISPDCERVERTKHIQQFLNRMQFSGYNERDRVTIYRKACAKF